MKKTIRKRIGLISLIILIIYVFIVIYFVLFSDRMGRADGYSTYRYNLVLFDEIRRFVKYRENVSTISFIINIFGNLVVFFPIGFLIPIWRTKPTGVIRIAGFSFLFSLFIESVQLVAKVGVFDVDDLFMNTLGGIVGWICYFISIKIFRKTFYSNKHKKGNYHTDNSVIKRRRSKRSERK